MKTNVLVQKEIVVILSEREAKWLMAFIQNSPDDETAQFQDMRRELFTALKEGVGNESGF